MNYKLKEGDVFFSRVKDGKVSMNLQTSEALNACHPKVMAGMQLRIVVRKVKDKQDNMNKDNKYLAPASLFEPLRSLGLEREFILWQDATDFLREKFFTHIIIYPQDTMTPPYYVFDFTIISPYGSSWEDNPEDEKLYTDYYEALQKAITLSIEGINEAHGKDKSST